MGYGWNWGGGWVCWWVGGACGGCGGVVLYVCVGWVGGCGGVVCVCVGGGGGLGVSIRCDGEEGRALPNGVAVAVGQALPVECSGLGFASQNKRQRNAPCPPALALTPTRNKRQRNAPCPPALALTPTRNKRQRNAPCPPALALTPTRNKRQRNAPCPPALALTPTQNKRQRNAPSLSACLPTYAPLEQALQVRPGPHQGGDAPLLLPCHASCVVCRVCWLETLPCCGHVMPCIVCRVS